MFAMQQTKVLNERQNSMSPPSGAKDNTKSAVSTDNSRIANINDKLAEPHFESR
jgi:hypothetical protein